MYFWFVVILSILVAAFLFMVARSLLLSYGLLEPLKEWAWKKVLQIWKAVPFLKIIYGVVALIIGSALSASFGALYWQVFSFPFDIENIKKIDSNFALAFLGTITGIVALFGGYLAIRRTEANEREATTAEQGLITDRINKATEGLGKSNQENGPVIEVRLGALYALERIAQDSLRDHIQIMEIICAYIRTNSPLSKETDEQENLNKDIKTDTAKKTNKATKIDASIENDEDEDDEAKKLREDIQAALTIIGRRENWSDSKKRLEAEKERGYQIDLSYCDLRYARIYRANLSRTNIEGANLSHAQIMYTDLSHVRANKTTMIHVNLDGSDLSDSLFYESNLRRAQLNNTDMSEAGFNDTNLTHASISGARMVDAGFWSADLSHAWIHGSNLIRARFDMAKLIHTDIGGTNLTDTSFRYADMSNALIDEAFVYTGDFTTCKNFIPEDIEETFCGIQVKLPNGFKPDPDSPTGEVSYDDFMKKYKKWLKKRDKIPYESKSEKTRNRWKLNSPRWLREPYPKAKPSRYPPRPSDDEDDE